MTYESFVGKGVPTSEEFHEDIFLMEYLYKALDAKLSDPLFTGIDVYLMITVWRRGKLKNTKVMEVQPKRGTVYYHRVVPRYVGDVKKISPADPEMVDKIIDELFAR